MITKILWLTIAVLSLPIATILILAICIVLMSRKYTGEKGDKDNEDT